MTELKFVIPGKYILTEQVGVFFKPACRVWRENARGTHTQIEKRTNRGLEIFPRRYAGSVSLLCFNSLSIGANKGVWKYILVYVFYRTYEYS
jgi:hypothetical protein